MSLTIHLEPEVNARLRAEAARLGLQEEEVAAKLIDNSLPVMAVETEDDSEYIMLLTDRIASTLPTDSLKDIPTDLSKNLDHYLYGHPKRD